MQRLFSMFPSGSPGVALVLLRVALGALMLDGVLAPLSGLNAPWVLAVPWAVAIGLFLGLGTPVLAGLAIVIEAGTVAFAGATLQAIHACALFDAASLALLGPGAYSLDARIFGRKRITLQTPPDDASPH